MKKMRKLTSLLLVLVMSLALAVPAFAVSYTSQELGDNAGGYAFTKWSVLHFDGFEYRVTANIKFDNSIGRTYLTAILCNSDGKTLQTGYGTSGGSKLVFANTSGYAGTDAYAAKGEAEINGAYVKIPGVDKYNRDFTRSRRLQESLGEVKSYPVNSHGETYGSTMLADVIGYEPDLISAIGVDGVEGYIRYSDVRAGAYHAPVISLYNQEGIVIGTFVNGAGDSLEVSK